jgi:hypothetical protein
MNGINIKLCSKIEFNCGDTMGSSCWCNDFHLYLCLLQLLTVFVRIVLKEACSDKIDDYISTLTPETIVNNKIAFLPKSPRLIEGIDYYLENNNYVLKLFFI